MSNEDGAKVLAFVHHSLAVATKQPLIQISIQEGEILYIAINDLAIYYGISLAPVYGVWSKLAAALTGVYGPRVMQARMLAAKARAERNAPFGVAPQQPGEG